MDFDMKTFLGEIKLRQAYAESGLQNCLTRVEAYPPLIHKAMHYTLFNGGKRLRPIMVFEAALLAGGHREDAIPAACAIEMIHSYSLVHDDLPCMDDDDFRRGKPTCHKVFGEAIAVLTGDALLTAAFELLSGSPQKSGTGLDKTIRVIAEIAKAAGSRGMIGGQVIDLESEGKNIDFATLRTLHSLKTGELFRASLRSGAILGGMDEPGLQAITDYALSFGLAFQISDDILDVQGDEVLIGKPVGSDAKNHKTTYPSLLGLEKSKELLKESVDLCIQSLKPFGEQADFLRQLACFTMYRES
ncbi:MAG: polyprenyl synthetase family protein [Syntrophomonas sp.]